MTTEKITCADCGEEIELDAAHEVDGSAYCDDCVVQCEDCGDYVLNGDAKTNDSGDNYCESCYDDNYVKCEACGCEVRKDRAYSSDSGDDYCRDCYNENFSHCESCNCEVHNEDSVSTESGDTYCQSCYDDHYDHCSSCGCEVSTDDTVCVNGDVYCEGCAPSDSNEWEPGFFRPVQSCGKVGSRRMFGVELETSACPDYYELEGSTVFGAKDDGSIDGKEFVSPILSSDAGFDAINDFCKRAGRMGFNVDAKCGFHAHCDVRDLSVAQLKSVAYANDKTYKVWAAFVISSRRNNHYCEKHGWDKYDLARIDDMQDWKAFARSQTRYAWLNVAAYDAHGTLEVRLHTSTLEGKKVCNWVAAHTRFIDKVRNMTWKEIDALFGDSVESGFAGLSKVWNDSELTDYFAGRAEKFGTNVKSEEFAYA